MTTSQNDPLGFDMHYGPHADGSVDIDARGSSCSGLALASDEIYRRVTSDKVLSIGNPNGDANGMVDFGRDVRKWIGAATTPAQAAARGPELAIAIQRSARIASCNVSVSVAQGANAALYDLTISIFAVCVNPQTGASAGAVSIVYGVNALSVDLLESL